MVGSRPRPEDVRAGSPTDAGLIVGVAALAIAAWAIAVGLMLDRGLDITDEGFYLLSYRWWDTSTRNFSGVQYIYGPVLDLLGGSVPRLRAARLLSVVVVHLYFAWCFLTWLRATGRIGTGQRRLGAAVVLTVLSGGALVYSWLPLSPGYNDVAALGALALSGTVLCVAASLEADTRLPLLLVFLSGFVAGSMLLAKWASGLVTVAFLVAVCAVIAERSRWRAMAVALGCGVAGFAVWAALFDVVVMPWSDVLGPLADVNAIVSQGSNSPGALLWLYAVGTAKVLAVGCVSALVGAGPLLVARRTSPSWSRALVVAGPLTAVAVVAALTGSLPQGGVRSIFALASTLTALFVLAVLVTVVPADKADKADHVPTRPGDRRRRTRAVGAMLLLVPVAQALGTGNDLYFLVLACTAPWLALLVTGWLSARDGAASDRAALSTILVVSLLVIGWTAVSATLLHPYRTSGYADSDTPLEVAGPLQGIRLDSDTAGSYESLAGALAPHLDRHTSVLGLDEIPGLVLLLGRPPLGEAWTSSIDPERTAAGTRSACERGTGSVTPVILSQRPLTRIDVNPLRECDIAFYADYRLLPTPGAPAGVRAYVPRDP